ncbi:MAG: SCO family protein [Gemmataceae bacterium]|nr:SCO family protein [Gemmataceae bacterium]
MMQLLMTVLIAVVDPSVSRLPVIRSAPDFQLIDANNQAVTLSQFRGKAVLVAFFFTTCSGTCPATTARLGKVQEALAKDERLKDSFHLISITLDPQRDTTEKLRNYQRLYDVDPRTWSFLTGTADDIRQLLAALRKSWKFPA